MLEQSGLDLLILSIDSINESTFSKIRRKIDFVKVMHAVELLCKSKLRSKLKVRMVLQKINMTEVPEFIAFWEKLGIPVEIMDVTNRNGMVPDFEMITVSGLKDFDDDVLSFCRRQISMTVKVDGKNRFLCPYPFYRFSILADGSVIKCCQDWTHLDILSNVALRSIEDIWNNEFQVYRNLFLKGEAEKIAACKNCSLIHER